MQWLKHAATYIVWGAPVWVWFVTLVVLPIVNEVVQRKDKFKSQSLIQVLGNFALAAQSTPLSKVPAIGQLLAALALLKTKTPPAIEQPDSASSR